MLLVSPCGTIHKMRITKAIASVRFTGPLRENNGMPENVDEIWHVQKNLRDDKSVWLLAGIQQTTLH